MSREFLARWFKGCRSIVGVAQTQFRIQTLDFYTGNRTTSVYLLTHHFRYSNRFWYVERTWSLETLTWQVTNSDDEMAGELFVTFMISMISNRNSLSQGGQTAVRVERLTGAVN